MKNSKIYFFGYFFFLVLLFIYSFTQIDLGLTFSSSSVWLPFQKAFQYIGYFNRPLSAGLYIFIFLGLIFSYLMIAFKAKSEFLYDKYIKAALFFIILLSFSYNAFSYDLFNYIFDAKIITAYNENPYFKKALDFPQDPMLSFMHWTHRVYPYGPSWLLLTVPLSFIGGGIFLITFFLFKILTAACFLGSIFIIKEISREIFKTDGRKEAVLFALNPLLLIESIVSAHNDIVMMFFIILGFYLIIRSRLFFGVTSFVFSVGVKFATIFLIPVFLYLIYLKINKKTINWEKIFLISFLSMIPALVIASLRTNFQPWYMIYLLIFLPLLKNIFIKNSLMIASVFLCFYYLPYVYTGNWNDPIPLYLNYFVLFIIGLSISLSFLVMIKFKSVK